MKLLLPRFGGLLVLLCCLWALECQADAGMDKFYSQKKNQAAFDKAQQAEKIKKGKQAMIDACARAKKINAKTNCACVKNEIGKISDKAFFYESIMAVQLYQAAVKAMKANDKKRLAEIKAKRDARQGLAKTLAEKCGMQ